MEEPRCENCGHNAPHDDQGYCVARINNGWETCACNKDTRKEPRKRRTKKI